MNATDLAKSYDPRVEEPKVRERWEKAKPFRVNMEAPGEPYSIVIPPPNVTAPLHLGHALNNTLQDILIRYHRMKGCKTLWMPGTDHAGIATQTVVEKRLLETEGRKRTDFKRDEFIARVQEWKDRYEADITDQLQLMGCSCDWDRQRFTMDEMCARSVREAFFQLFKDGLIYRGKRLVNWDPATQTALADDEVENEEVDGFFWYLRYPVVDDDGKETGEFVTVATTRPETMLGDTAVAVNPNDLERQQFIGRRVRLPIVGRLVPIIGDDYVVLPDAESSDPKAKYASGFLKVTPAHDLNDWEIGMRHSLDVINVMAPDGTMSREYGWKDEEPGLEPSEFLESVLGLDRYEARESIVNWFRENDLLEDVKPYRHSIGHSYRSHVAIEPYLSDQWYVRVRDHRLRGAALNAMVEDQRGEIDDACAYELKEDHREFLRSSGRDARSTEDKDDGADGFASSGTGVSPVQKKEEVNESTVRTGIAQPPKIEVTEDLSIRRRYLPHWQMGGRTYFLTFRLVSGELSEDERKIVVDACLHWHEERMFLHLVTVMPDHVHLLITPLRKKDDKEHWYSLAELMQSIKGFTAHEINDQRNTAGVIWQDEYFDRIVRDDAEFAEKWNYIWGNPVKAGLVAGGEEYGFTVLPGNSGGGDLYGRDARTTGEEHDQAIEGAEDCTGETPAPPRQSWHGQLRFYPERYAKTFKHWHENLRDWCISRQLWWGHRIPVWGLPGDATQTGPNPEIISQRLAELKEQYADDLFVKVLHREAHEIMSRDLLASSNLTCCLRRDIPQLIEELEAMGFKQDPDVLDTWFSSALWPISTMGWPVPEDYPTEIPEGSALLKMFNPTNVLTTAREIITLWVSRMVMFNTYFQNRLPFTDVFIHAMIQDGEGRKMSKSLGNGVDPRDIIKSMGTDAMRFTLTLMTTQTQDVRMPVEYDAALEANTSPKFEVGRRLCNKLWNATRFALSTLSRVEGTGDSKATPTRLIDRWMLSRLARTMQECEGALREYQFSVYAQTFYDLFWRDFCDWYLEGIKGTVREDAIQQSVLRAVLGALHRLAHPIMPFITETLHSSIEDLDVRPLEAIQLPSSALASLAGWPICAGTLIDSSAESEFETIRTLISAIREVRSRQNVPDRRLITLHLGDRETGRRIAEAEGVVEIMAGLEVITPDQPTGNAITVTVAGVDHRLSNLAEAVDTGAEQERLGKRKDELAKQIGNLKGRLANKKYVDKAPVHLVDETRQQLSEAEAELAGIAEALSQVNG